jgi:hypothetical protein
MQILFMCHHVMITIIFHFLNDSIFFCVNIFIFIIINFQVAETKKARLNILKYLERLSKKFMIENNVAIAHMLLTQAIRASLLSRASCIQVFHTKNE